DGRRTHSLLHGVDAGRRHAFIDESLRGDHQADAGHDDAVIGRYQPLLSAIDNRTHALLNSSILHGKTLNAAERSAGLLRSAIHQVVVIFVSKWPIAAGLVFDVDSLAGPHRLHLLATQWTRRVILVAPRPAVFVVNRNPEVPVYGVVSSRRDHRETRH